MGFKSKMMNDYLLPALNGGESSLRSLGIVVKVDEKSNTCGIQYRDKKNRRITKYGVHIRTDSSVVGWFPDINDQVIVEINNGVPTVIGEYEKQSAITNKSRTTLDNDIYSDNLSCETAGGYIF